LGYKMGRWMKKVETTALDSLYATSGGQQEGQLKQSESPPQTLFATGLSEFNVHRRANSLP